MSGNGTSLVTCVHTGNRVKVSAARCNLLIRDVDSKYDPSGSPVGFYELALDRPYERAICIKLLRQVANNSSYEFLRCAYDPKPAPPASCTPTSLSSRSGESPAASRPINIPATATDLHLKSVLTTREDFLEEEEKIHLKKLLEVERAAVDIKFANALFRQYDTNRSGALDREEVRDLLKQLGMTMEEETFDHVMDFCDIDNSGEIEVSSFVK